MISRKKENDVKRSCHTLLKCAVLLSFSDLIIFLSKRFQAGKFLTLTEENSTKSLKAKNTMIYFFIEEKKFFEEFLLNILFR